MIESCLFAFLVGYTLGPGFWIANRLFRLFTGQEPPHKMSQMTGLGCLLLPILGLIGIGIQLGIAGACVWTGWTMGEIPGAVIGGIVALVIHCKLAGAFMDEFANHY
jgi:hypothetical protein